MEIPKFVKLGHTALRLTGKTYYRDGGQWSVKYKIVDGVLLSSDRTMPWLDNKPLIEITEGEWRKDNEPYAPNGV